MEHSSHQHLLILNEQYIAAAGDVCRGCNEQIVSCKSYVYSCSGIPNNNASVEEYVAAESMISRSILGTGSFDDGSDVDNVCAKFLLHKSCAELPPYIPNPNNPKESLKICFIYSQDEITLILRVRSLGSSGFNHDCCICGVPIPWKLKVFFYSGADIYVCIDCSLSQVQALEDPKFEHPAHSQHQLALIQHPSSFKCYACKVDDNIKDMSYRCTKCQFWMHKSCSDAPTSFRFHFHDKHPLILSFSLPQIYRKFIQYCRICDKILSRINWIYYCPKCRVFAHFQCARSSQMLSSSEDETYNPELVHLPAADEASAILLGEQFVKALSTLKSNSNSIFSATNATHWAHDEHPLQLISFSVLFDEMKDDAEMLLLCDGCVKPIRTDADLFYGCVPCKFFLHKFCAELPKSIEHHLYPGTTLRAAKYSKPCMIYRCLCCGVSCNGIFFSTHPKYSRPLHIGCAALPKMIKHEAHPHKLNQIYSTQNCKACGVYFPSWKHWCEQCDICICEGCITKARTVKHPWDSHPLRLIYESGMVIDHEHDFNCEFCSRDIDTNFWFYHCSDCDLSLHLNCFGKPSHHYFTDIKFGAANIIINRLHRHSLTFVLNKKVCSCEECESGQLGRPVLECAAPCKAIFCTDCISECGGTMLRHILYAK